MITKSYTFIGVRRLIFILTIIFIGIYLFLVVPHAFSGLPDFVAALLFSGVLYSITRYLSLPWFFGLAHFNIVLFLLLFLTQIFLLYVLLILFSLATGALVWGPGEWYIANFWEVMLLLAPPQVLAILMYIWERGLKEWYIQHKVRERLKELEDKDDRWQILSLQKTISPHFISNTLSAIRVLVRRDGTKALEALNHMVSISNFYIAQQTQLFVSLADELRHVDNLVEIYALRHGKDIAFIVDLDVQMDRDVWIPTMLLINLVENALQYGVVDDKKNPIILTLTVSPSAFVSIVVKNNISRTVLDGIVSFGSTHKRLNQQIQFLDADTGFFETEQEGQSYQALASFSSKSNFSVF